MKDGRAGLALGGFLVVLAACAPGASQRPSEIEDGRAQLPAERRRPTTSAATVTTTATTVPATAASTTSSTTSTTSSTTTTTTIVHPRDAHDPACVIEVQAGDSLSLIADQVDKRAVTIDGLQAENGISDVDVIHPGDYVDICVGNELDDITGKERRPPRERPSQQVVDTGRTGVVEQQKKLNELFGAFGTTELAVDGVSGPLTQQQLCAARLALGLPVSRADMAPGSEEEQVLMSAESVAIPPGAATWADRWVLIDVTCQIMFAGEGENGITFIFPTSTGMADFPTDQQDAAEAFRYDPALENNGWHDSSTFPASVDNPLNGNMYRPVYFNSGEAIHGANTVPPEPASHGCARLATWHQDALVSWLGLDGASGAIYDAGQINLVVSVHGAY